MENGPEMQKKWDEGSTMNTSEKTKSTKITAQMPNAYAIQGKLGIHEPGSFFVCFSLVTFIYSSSVCLYITRKPRTVYLGKRNKKNKVKL